MFDALSAPQPHRRLVSLLAIFLCSALIVGSIAPAAFAQNTLIAPAQTKEEAEQAARDAANAEDDGGIGISLQVGLVAIGFLFIGGVAYFISRDARGATADADNPNRRDRPKQPAVNPGSVRGAPSTMFAGEGAPGGKTGRQKKREKSKRQKAARKNNR